METEPLPNRHLAKENALEATAIMAAVTTAAAAITVAEMVATAPAEQVRVVVIHVDNKWTGVTYLDTVRQHKERFDWWAE